MNDTPGGPVELLTELPDAWRGEPFAVHGAPIARGTGVVRRALARTACRVALGDDRSRRHAIAPSLDPEWSTTEARGEALFALPESPR